MQSSVQEIGKRNARVLGTRFNSQSLIRILGTEKKMMMISGGNNGRKEKNIEWEIYLVEGL